MVSFSELYRQTRQALLAAEEPADAAFLARNLVCFFGKIRREELLTHGDRIAPEDVIRSVEEGTARLLRGEPLAYVLGEWEFRGMTLKVTPDVLIPRDDTCAVTDLAVEALQGIPNARVLDLCTGSGCIGLAIFREAPGTQVVLGDISPAALQIAAENAAAQSSEAACRIVNALENPPENLGKFDLIVSNPPYITGQEMKELPSSVSDFEPHLALYGGEDGLVFYRAIAENFRAALNPGGFLCFEFGMGQGDGVCAILETCGFTVLKRLRDLNEIERAVLARYGRKEESHGNEKDRL